MKKVFAMILSLTMLVGLTACGQSVTGGDTCAAYVQTQQVVELYAGEELLSETRTEYTRDTAGNVTEMNVYSNNKLTETEKLEETDESGRPLKFTVSELTTGQTFTKTVEYDEAGNEVKTTYWSGEVIYMGHTRTFDEAGNLLTLETVQPADGIHSITTYTYNEDGTLASMLVDMGSRGAMLTVYEYDDQGRCVKETAYEGKTTSDPVRDVTEAVYTEGKCTKTTTPVSGNTLASSTVITYDEAGNEISKEVYNDEGVLTIRTTATYQKLS